MTLRIAGAQIPVTNNVADNQAAIGRAIDFAAAERADILLTPEGSLSGYRPDFPEDQVATALDAVTRKAATAGTALALGTCWREADGNCYNQIRFYDAGGAYLGFHSKILLCGSMTDPPQGEINHYHAVAELRTFEIGSVCVGALICNDLWANPCCTPMPDPHLSQQLTQMGAKVILHAVNAGEGDFSHISRCASAYHEANLQLRAAVGQVWVVTVDSCYPTDQPCSAPSGVIDPEGRWRLRARPMGEDLFVYTIE